MCGKCYCTSRHPGRQAGEKDGRQERGEDWSTNWTPRLPRPEPLVIYHSRCQLIRRREEQKTATDRRRRNEMRHEKTEKGHHQQIRSERDGRTSELLAAGRHSPDHQSEEDFRWGKSSSSSWSWRCGAMISQAISFSSSYIILAKDTKDDHENGITGEGGKWGIARESSWSSGTWLKTKEPREERPVSDPIARFVNGSWHVGYYDTQGKMMTRDKTSGRREVVSDHRIDSRNLPSSDHSNPPDDHD